MSKQFQEIQREIKSGKIASVYIVTGQEEWSRMKFLALIKKTVIDPGMEDFNFDHLQAQETKGVAVADKAGMLPMMADWRLVIVENCQTWKKKDVDGITKYLSNINEKACLVLLFEDADRRKKLFQSKSPLVRYVDFPKPKRWELEGYVRNLALDMKLKLDVQACTLVAELAGDDLARVHSELEKLSLYKLGSNQISAEDVEALMGRTRLATRWELNDFIGKRDLHGALLKMHHIMDSGEDATSLLSVVNGCVRQLYLVKALMVKGIRDPKKIGQTIGLYPKIAEGLVFQQKFYSNFELRRAFQLMQETDVRIKSAGVDRRLVLDHLLTQIITQGPMSPPQPRVKQ